ncbi:hypothetical protein DL98DRAFT_273467 [Cadophora sp. DSE1049]|nr:hypothetical protein DL98DRAFT_273467 [Cadophora sp. DSE1049]
MAVPFYCHLQPGAGLSAKSIRTASDSHSNLFLDLANWTAPPLWRAPTRGRNGRSAPIRKRAAKLNDPWIFRLSNTSAFSRISPFAGTCQYEAVTRRQDKNDFVITSSAACKRLLFLVGIRPILVCSGAATRVAGKGYESVCLHACLWSTTRDMTLQVE